jgi:penicillin V acylase-like amidase (Ntn superfamily)
MKGVDMKKYVFEILFLINIVFIANATSNACTAFMAAKGNKVLTGRNADWSNLNARMLVLPASPGKYGTIYLGAEGGQGIGSFINTTGMNEQGLWYGSTSLYDGSAFPVRNDIRNYYNKPILNYNLIYYVMEVCSTVDEVIGYFTTYYYPVWNGHHLFVDRNGNSVIIEFGEKDVVFIRGKSNHQVMTNFPNADTLNARWYNCDRYKAADRMLASSQEISIDLFRSICDAVHQERISPTSLSTVYDVTNRNLYVYYFHNYEEVLVFNVNEELTKGENYYCSLAKISYFERLIW